MNNQYRVKLDASGTNVAVVNAAAEVTHVR
jgi:hypothetical protein